MYFKEVILEVGDMWVGTNLTTFWSLLEVIFLSIWEEVWNPLLLGYPGNNSLTLLEVVKQLSSHGWVWLLLALGSCAVGLAAAVSPPRKR